MVQSNLTVTIGFLKVGMLLGDAVQKMDQLAVADIGIRLIREDDFLAHPEEVVFFSQTVCPWRVPRKDCPPKQWRRQAKR